MAIAPGSATAPPWLRRPIPACSDWKTMPRPQHRRRQVRGEDLTFILGDVSGGPIDRHSGGLDHPPPLCNFGLLRVAESCRSKLIFRRHLQAEVFKLLAHCRIVQGIDGGGI